jgi:CelD/BcsL family acetyltransferase involved in cellulose biosynthesis
VSQISWQVLSEEPGSEILGAWDRLAIDRGRPYCAPGWMLGWGAPSGGESEPRIGVVREGERVIGLLPLAGRRPPSGEGARYELLGSGIGYRIEPLAASGRQRAVAGAAAEMLGSLSPALGVLSLDGIDAESGWGEALAAELPGGANLTRRRTLYAPFLEIAGAATYEEWLESRGGHFRKRAAADRRRFLGAGRLEIASSAAELERAIGAFVSLHLARWRGRSHLDFPSMAERLLAVGERLGPERLRASLAVIGGEIVSVDLFVHAGEVAASWNGGWLEAHSALRPGWQTLTNGIEDAIERGVREIDLGPGEHPWKRRLATRDGSVLAERLVPGGTGS